MTACGNLADENVNINVTVGVKVIKPVKLNSMLNFWAMQYLLLMSE